MDLLPSSLTLSLPDYAKAEKLCAEYAKAKGPGLTARLEAHQFFLRIKPKLNLHLEKAERENGFM